MGDDYETVWVDRIEPPVEPVEEPPAPGGACGPDCPDCKAARDDMK
jgi:hypothetical protein